MLTGIGTEAAPRLVSFSGGGRSSGAVRGLQRSGWQVPSSWDKHTAASGPLGEIHNFPECYNYDFKSPNYTGQCPPNIRAQNDQLRWLWAQSCALYPSIYLPAALENRRRLNVRAAPCG